MNCSVEGCDKPIQKRNWCNAHYKRWLRHGNPTAGERLRRPKGLSEADAFRWFMPGPPPAEGCWDWTASVTGHGYGQFSTTQLGKVKIVLAHRASFRIFKGDIPDGWDILHSCDRPICVQPAHLRLGDAAENSRDCCDRGRQARGERNGQSKLSADDIVWIRNSSLTQAKVAQKYNLHQSTVSRIIGGKRRGWKHIT